MFLILFLTLNCISQTSKKDLQNTYKAFNEIKTNPNKKILVDYLFDQYSILDEIENKSKVLLKSPPESEISKLELIGYEFLENMEKFSSTYEEKPNALNEKELANFSKIHFELRQNFEIYRMLLNNFKTDKDLFTTLKANNSTLRISLNEFIQNL